ncbi:Nuclear factor Y-box C [Carabus blaptoides fortunei]
MSVFFVNTGTEGETETQHENTSGEASPAASEAQLALQTFWPKVMDDIKKIGMLDLKNQVLPLARIKKIMKLDEEVKMISAEAPMLFAKAAEIFIHELTLRAWVHTEDNKRRTLQRNDIAMAITKYDQFDFLIDIVPRDEIKPARIKEESGVRTSMNPDQVQYYFQLAQQHQAALQQNTNTPQTVSATTVAQPTIQIVQPQVQTVQVNPLDTNTGTTSTVTPTTSQVLLQQNQTSPQQQPGSIQIVQQVVTPNGEIQQIPIQLTPQQIQMIRNQVQLGTGQPIIIQTPMQPANQPQLIQVAQQSAGGGPVYLTQSNGTNEGD